VRIFAVKFIIETDDPAIAAELLKVASGGKIKETKAVEPKPTIPVAAVSAPIPQAVAAAPVVAVPVAAVPPSAPPSAELALTPEDQEVLDQGWTVDHIKDASTAYVGKRGGAGAAGFRAILAKYGAERVANGKNVLAPRHYPAVHAELIAAVEEVA